MSDELKKEREQLEKEKLEFQEQRKQLERESQLLNSRINENTAMTTSKVLGFMEPFNADIEDWSQWIERLEQYFDLNEITDEKKQVAMLLTMVGSKGYNLFRNLCLPDLPKSKTFKQLTKLMQNHLQPPPSEIAERYKFKLCMQKDSEDVKTFCARLKGLSMHCNFKTQLTENLRDQFVCGIESSSTKEKLLRSGIATAMEIALKNTAGMNSASQAPNHVNVIKEKHKKHFGKNKQKKNSNGNNKGNTDNSENCKHCGKNNHKSFQCRYKEYVCNKCNNKGHLAIICKRGNSQNEYHKIPKKYNEKSNEKQHYMEDQSSEINFNFNDDININYFESDLDDKVFVTVKINNESIKFEVDSGSPITAISSEFYKSKGPCRIR